MLEVRVRLRPGAGADELLGFEDGVLQARVSAPPVDGRANQALCRLIAKRVGVAPSQVSVVRGEKARLSGSESRRAMRRSCSAALEGRGADPDCGEDLTSRVDLGAAQEDPRRCRRAAPTAPPRSGSGWRAGSRCYEEMTNLPAALRERLAADGAALDARRVRGRGEVRRRHRQDALRHRRRPADRGGADALPRRAALGLRLLAVGLPAHLHLLRHRADEVRPQPQRRRDPRPGAALPPRSKRSTTSSSWGWGSRR